VLESLNFIPLFSVNPGDARLDEARQLYALIEGISSHHQRSNDAVRARRHGVVP